MEQDACQLKEQIKSSANYGMLAGFWTELPVLVYGALQSNVESYWEHMHRWSARLVLPATLVGVAYGWHKASVQGKQQSWAEAEEMRHRVERNPER